VTDERDTNETEASEPITSLRGSSESGTRTSNDGALEGARRPASPPGSGSARYKAVLVLAAVFALGGVAGAAVGRVTALRELRRTMEGPPAEARARFRLEALRRHLDLSEDQLARMRTVIDEAESERDAAMAACGPGLDELRRRTDTRVREILNEEQRKHFDELEARRGHHGGGPRPGRPPPSP
jgi:hypothetical protein